MLITRRLRLRESVIDQGVVEVRIARDADHETQILINGDHPGNRLSKGLTEGRHREAIVVLDLR